LFQIFFESLSISREKEQDLSKISAFERQPTAEHH